MSAEETEVMHEETHVEETTEEVVETGVEDEARAMGWVPKDEFKGDPERWRPADEFVDRGKNMLPIIQERYRSQSQELADMKKAMKAMKEYQEHIAQRSYDRAIEELKVKQLEAVSEGDTMAYTKINNEIEALEKDKPAPVALPDDDPSQSFEYKSWEADNAWYNSDAEARIYAESIGQFVRQQNPNAQGRDFLDLVTEEVKKRYPQKFGSKKPSIHSVESGSTTVSRKTKSKQSYESLPPEAKAACDRFVKQGVLTKEQYVKDFFGTKS